MYCIGTYRLKVLDSEAMFFDHDRLPQSRECFRYATMLALRILSSTTLYVGSVKSACALLYSSKLYQSALCDDYRNH
jgi:hypothetical protein